MPRGPMPDRMNRRRAPPPPSFEPDLPRGRPGRSPGARRKGDRSADFQRGFAEPPRRDRMSPPPPPPRRRSRSPMGKPRERMHPMTPPPPGRSMSPRHSRKPQPSKMPRSKSPKAMVDKSYSVSSKFPPNSLPDEDLLGEKKTSFGSGVMDRSMFRGPEAYTSYDPDEIKKIRIFIRRRLTSSDAEPMPVNHMAQEEMSFNHRSDRDPYREPPKMKRLEEHFRPPKDHRGKEMSSWNDHPEPMNMRDAPPPYSERPGLTRDRYRSPPHGRKHEERMPSRGFERKPPRDDFHAPDGHFPPQRLVHDNGRAEFDRRPSPVPYGRGRDEGLRDDRLDGRARLGDKRIPSGRPKHDGPYPPMERERRPSPVFVDPYRRSPVDRYRKGVSGRSMSPQRRSGPPPMERPQHIDRRREGLPRDERFRSPPRSRETMTHPNDMMPRRGRGGRGSGPNYRSGPPQLGSPPQRRNPPQRGGFSNQSRRPPYGRK